MVTPDLRFQDLAHLYDETHQTRLVILSIDMADDANTAETYVVKMGYKWPNFHDPGEVDAAFGTEGIPRSILLNAAGEVVLDRVSCTAEELRHAIANLGPEYAAALGLRR